MPRAKKRPQKRGLDQDTHTGLASGSSLKENSSRCDQDNHDALLQSLKESSNFHIKVVCGGHKNHSDPVLESLHLRLSEDVKEPEVSTDLKLYVNVQTPSQSFLLLSHKKYHLLKEDSIKPHIKTFEGLFHNKSGLVLELFKWNPLELKVILCSRLLKPLEHPSQVPINVSFASKALAIRYFLGESLDDENPEEEREEDSSSNITKPDIDSIYDALKNYHTNNSIPLMKDSPHNPQHPSLKPKLRPYRRNAIIWMINQERDQSRVLLSNENLHSLYVPVMNSKYYLNKHGGFVVDQFPKDIRRTSGGILADEMGLGKTVEILSLILCHPRVDVEKPSYLEPIMKIKESKKRLLRRKADSLDVYEIQDNSIPQMDGMHDDESSDFSYNPSDFESDDEDYKPDEPEEKDEAYIPKASTSATSIRKESLSTIKSTQVENFDPLKLVKSKKITNKSPLSDLILSCLIKLSKGDYDSLLSGHAIKKTMDQDYNKSGAAMNKKINKILTDFVKNGTLLSTNGSASGSFCFNVRGEDSTQIKLKSNKQQSSVYNKLKAMYEMQLKEMSMVKDESCRVSGKRWKGSYFDTKVHQTDFFECICGADEYDDDLTRVQCSVCTIRQHAQCVKFNLRNPHRGEYKCPHCWAESKPVPSKGTLIVSPDSISYQWIEEIQKHVTKKGLKILYYKGTKLSGYIQPRDLGSYDVVVTTYSVLNSETDHVDLPHSNSSDGRKFRNPKRFMAIPAPLTAVEWWRVCLDEAQMIEGSTITRTAQMALRLSSVNKWCVTGTPIGKSVNDLFGLFLFLDYDPYSVNFWWKTLVYTPFCRGDIKILENLLGLVMWRTAKRDILDQISIPSQTEQIHWLSFSPIEEHFYRRQHVDSSKEIVARIRRLQNHNLKLSELDRNTIGTILRPMLKLRQSCCHPQVVKGEFLSLQKSSITMEELLNQMIKKNTVECEESHRAHISSLNGLAGLHIINEEWKKAVEVYREVLRLVVEYEEKIKTDTLQLLHTLTNLSEILDAKHEGISPTLRDESLIDESKKLKNKYLSKYIETVSAAEGALSLVTIKVDNLFLETKSSSSSEPWYVRVINSISSSSDESSLLKLVKDEMAQFYDVVHDREFKEISEKYSNSRIIMYKIASGITDSDNCRKQVLKGMKLLKDSPLESFVNNAVDCHLRTSALSRKNKKKCELCSIHDDIEVYEKSIFHFVKGDLKTKQLNRSGLSSEDNKKLEEAGVYLLENQRIGNWTESETERLIRAVLKYLRTNKPLVSMSNEEGSTHLSLIEATKKEFKLIRILWRQVHDMVAAMDELNMCVMRLRLKYDDEPDLSSSAFKGKQSSSHPSADLSTREKDKFETIYIIEKHEIPSQKLKLVSEKTIAINEFRKKYGQLLYLENLKKTDFKENGGENPDPCPICQKELGRQWSVLQCGHSYCVECIRTLIDEYSSVNRRSLQCPMCRSMTFHSEISYVNTVKEESSEFNNIDEKALEDIKGSLSTKIESIVKTLFVIQKNDPDAKTLIFSSWADLLNIIAVALLENNIAYASLYSQGKFKRNLLKFKNRKDVKVLLLPISSGANGLNLIEASHVFLVEPILNPAQELQAIGRVHRIGQTKPTVVHRFLIRSTVEERMHKILSSYQRDEAKQGSHSTEENLITIKDLKNIFNDDCDDVN